MPAHEVDRYLDAAPQPQQSTLRQLRALLNELLPEAEERLSYAIPAVVVGGKSIAGYAALKAHCSYFPHSGRVVNELKDQLAGYDASKGTIRFPVDEPLPRELVEALVDARLAELGFPRLSQR